MSVRSNGDPIIAAPYFEKHLIQKMPVYLQELIRAGAAFPFFVMITFARIKGFRIPMGVQYPWRVYPIEKEFLFLPDLVIEDADQNLPELFKETFCSLWQACGVSKSSSYDAQGNWNPTPY